MDIRLFYVTEDRSIGINKYCIVVRHYDSLKRIVILMLTTT